MRVSSEYEGNNLYFPYKDITLWAMGVKLVVNGKLHKKPE